MYTYKLTFNNGKEVTETTKNLTSAEDLAVAMMDGHEDLQSCEITTPTGALSIVRKAAAAHHWNHPGYTFSMVQPLEVERYRCIQAAAKQ